MDIFSHTLWAGAAAKALNRQNTLRQAQGLSNFKKPLNIWAAAFWGVFPDLFAFAIPALWLGWQVLFGHPDLSTYPRPGSGEPPPDDAYWPFRLAHALYNVSHSAVVFGVVFGILYLVVRRPYWEMGGWLLHILIDIPTHAYKFYPTPVFWPVLDWKFRYGFSWGIWWFLLLNYAVITIVYWFLWRKKKIARDGKPTVCRET